VQIGKGGLSDRVVDETKQSLEAHELIKVRVEDRMLAEDLARAAGAELAGTIGKIAILYRAREEKPKIHLP